MKMDCKRTYKCRNIFYTLKLQNMVMLKKFEAMSDSFQVMWIMS